MASPKAMIKNALFICITGGLAARKAILVIRLENNLAIGIRSGAVGGNMAEMKPRIVIGATNGAAMAFAAIEVRDK